MRKHKRSRRALALLLTGAMLCTLLPAAALAADPPGLEVVVPPSELGAEPIKIYANGMAITLEAKGVGTVIKDESGNELPLSGLNSSTDNGYDLFDCVIYGGCRSGECASTSVTMTGGTIRGIYGGGGFGATVTGNTSVSISGGTVSATNASVAAVCGGSKESPVGGSATVEISGGEIQGAVYGGGSSSSGTVGNGASVTLTGGTLGGRVYGSGGGAVTGAVTVTVGGGVQMSEFDGVVLNGSNETSGVDSITISTSVPLTEGAAVYVDLPRGAEAGDTIATGAKESDLGYIRLNRFSQGAWDTVLDRGAIKLTATPTVNGTDLYANGVPLILAAGSEDASKTVVYIDTDNSGTVTDGDTIFLPGDSLDGTAAGNDLSNWSIFGGSKSSAVAGGASITMTGGKVMSIYGGGNSGSTVEGGAHVKIGSGATVQNTVYGGGFSGDVTGDIQVIVDGTVGVNVYGGGLRGAIHGNASITVSGTVNSTAFGGGYSSAVTGNTSVTVKQGSTVKFNVYGGGSNDGSTVGTLGENNMATVTIQAGGRVGGDVYGGGSNGTVNGDAQVTVAGQVAGNVYGGDNRGEVTGTKTVTVGGGANIGGGTGMGVVLNGTGVTGGVDRFAIDPGLSGASVYVRLPAGYSGGTIATGAVASDLGQIHLTGPGAAGMETYRYADDIRVRAVGTDPTPLPTVESNRIYANGAALIIAADNGGTTVYVDEDRDGVLDPGDKSLHALNIANAPADGADLSAWSIYGGGNGIPVTGDTKLTMTGGKVQALYGGGYGANGGDATVTGNPSVTMTGGKAGYVVGGGFAAVTGNTAVAVAGEVTVQVIGGGFDPTMAGSAPVGGNTSVTLQRGGKALMVWGGGYSTVGGDTSVVLESGSTVSHDDRSSATVLGGGTAPVEGSASVTLKSGSKVLGAAGKTPVVLGGGGAGGTVGRDARVTIEANAQVGDENAAGIVSGGGMNAAVGGNTAVSVGGKVYGDVYGGGYQANVGTAGRSNTATVVLTSTANVTGTVYGGGAIGGVNGDTSVTLRLGAKAAHVYGGGEADAVAGGTAVTSAGTVSGKIFGGGSGGNVTGGTSVTLQSGGTATHIYGGGGGGDVGGKATVVLNSGAEATTAVFGGGGGKVGGTSVTLRPGSKTGKVYGGGDCGSVEGSTEVAIAGTVESEVYGGSYQGPVSGSASVLLRRGAEVGDVYGGGTGSNTATVGQGVRVTVEAGARANNVFANGAGAITGDAAVAIIGTVQGVSGSYAQSGTVSGDTTLTLGGEARIEGGGNSVGADLGSFTGKRFAISAPFTGAAHVALNLLFVHEAGHVIATGAHPGDSGYLVLVNSPVDNLTAVVEGTEIKLAAAATGPIVLTAATTPAQAKERLGPGVAVTGTTGNLTLTLTGNVVLKVPVEVRGGSHTLDLSGLTLALPAAESVPGLQISGGSLTIDGVGRTGYIHANGDMSAHLVSVTGGQLTLRGGGVDPHASYPEGCWPVSVTGGHFTMTGGEVNSISDTDDALYVSDPTLASLSGGIIQGTMAVGTGTVGDLLEPFCGYFTYDFTGRPSLVENTDVSSLVGSLSIFSTAVAEYTTDGGATWTRTTSLNDALTAMEAGTDAGRYQMRLLADVDLVGTISSGTFTLDLNGHTWGNQAVANCALRLSQTASLTIMDSRGGGSLVGGDGDNGTPKPAIIVGNVGSNQDMAVVLTLTGDQPFTLQGGSGLDNAQNSSRLNGAPAIQMAQGGTLKVSGTGAIQLLGGSGGDSATGIGGTSGPGVSASNATLTFSNPNASVTGGDGGSSYGNGTGPDGGHGLALDGGSLTVSAGTFTGGQGGWLTGQSESTGGLGGDGLAASNDADLTLTGGTFTGGPGAAGRFRGNGATLSKVHLKVEGGVFSGGTGLLLIDPNATDERWTIRGGDFTGDNYGLTAFGSGTGAARPLSITGGTFNCSGSDGYQYALGTNCRGCLSGGTFTGAGAVIGSLNGGTVAPLLAPGKALFDTQGVAVADSELMGEEYGQNTTLRVADQTAAPEALYTISGEVSDTKTSYDLHFTVRLLQNGGVLRETDLVSSSLSYSFSGVAPGLYTLAVENNSNGQPKTLTRLVTVADGDLTENFAWYYGTVDNQVVVDGAPPVTVGGLEDAAKAVSDSDSYDHNAVVVLTVAAAEDPEGAADIAVLAPGKTLDFLDITLTLFRTVGQNPTEEIDLGQSNDRVLELVLPWDFQAKPNPTVYRCHEGVSVALGAVTAPPADGQFRADPGAGYLHIFASKFSTYAVGYGATSSPSSSSSGTTAYTITATAGPGGTVSPGGRVRVNRGGSQTFIITPDGGYTVADVRVDGVSVGTAALGGSDPVTYTFEKVTQSHALEATFAPARAAWNPFADVAETDWFHDSVRAVYERGLMEGTSASTFSPAMGTDRGMLATILWRMAGRPEAGEGESFSDVDAAAWYAPAVAWASASGVALGYGDGRFGPTDPITREQLATILWRYAGSPAPAGGLDGFADGGDTSGFAREAMAWAAETGLLTGKPGGVLDPKGPATRAELAAVLARYAPAD